MRLKIGIRGHDLPNAPFDNISDFIKSFKQFDLDYLQLVINKSFVNPLDDNNLVCLANSLKENNIRVAMIGAYFNMIHPDIDKFKKGYTYFEKSLQNANLFDCYLVGSETGSLNGDKWSYVEGNHTDEAYNKVKEVVKSLKEYGAIYSTYPLIEGAWNHVVYKPSLLKQLLDEAGLDCCTLDLYNYLNIDNYLDHVSIFKEALALLKDKIKIIHIKDFVLQDDKLVQVGIGKGIMNYQEIMPLIINNLPNAILILEGVKKEDITSSIAYLRSYENE